MDYILVMTKSSTEKMVMYTGAKFGVIAGLIATWSISTAIAASELELGQSANRYVLFDYGYSIRI